MAKGDWGDWRKSLHPVFGSVKHGRFGFFMHGGRFAGSAGCIDIGGGVFGNQITDKVKNTINNSDRSELWVL